MNDSIVTERWLPVVGHEGLYEVSDQGRVKSLERRVPHPSIGSQAIHEKILRPGSGTQGHQLVRPCVDGYARSRWVHQLVLEAFIGPCPPGMECCHDDGDSSNNVASNLRWDTCTSNMADRAKHGTSNRGEQNGRSRVTEDQVRQIRVLCEHSDLTQKEIGEMYGASPSVISQINTGRSWVWLD